MIRQVDESILDQAISFVARLNQDLAQKISYFGDTRAEIEADFSALQTPEGCAFVGTRADGSVIGFFGIEMDRKLGRSWLFGPLVDHPDWDKIADLLYASASAALPIEIADQEIFCHTLNSRVQDFAQRQGFEFHAEGTVLALDIADWDRTRPFAGFEFAEDYFPQFSSLHAELFPNTYYSAEQLVELSREEDKCLLVHLEDGVLAGYAFIQVRPASRDGYIDFIGVTQAHRRKGIGRKLVAQAVDWAVQKPIVERITLTVNSDNEAALNLYHSAGFITESVSRAYRKRTGVVEIQGQRVLIRATSRADLDNLMELWNDGRVMHWVGFPDGLGYDREAVQAWFEELQADPGRHHFVVLSPEIGFCGEVYYAVDALHHRASLDIKLHPGAQGQGFATDALQTLIRHVFTLETGVDAVWTQPSQANTAARALYDRCGLKPGPRPADILDGESFWVLTRAEAKHIQAA